MYFSIGSAQNAALLIYRACLLPETGKESWKKCRVSGWSGNGPEGSGLSGMAAVATKNAHAKCANDKNVLCVETQNKVLEKGMPLVCLRPGQPANQGHLVAIYPGMPLTLGHI